VCTRSGNAGALSSSGIKQFGAVLRGSAWSCSLPGVAWTGLKAAREWVCRRVTPDELDKMPMALQLREVVCVGNTPSQMWSEDNASTTCSTSLKGPRCCWCSDWGGLIRRSLPVACRCAVLGCGWLRYCRDHTSRPLCQPVTKQLRKGACGAARGDCASGLR